MTPQARLWLYGRRHVWRLVWGAFMLLCTNATTMAIPQLFRWAVDGILQGGDTHFLVDLAVLLLLVAAAGALFRVLSRVHIFYAGRDVELNLRDEFYRHLTRQPPQFFAVHPTGDLMSRVTNDLTQVRLLLGPGLLNLFNTAIAFAVAVPLMLVISPWLSGVSLVIFVPGLVLVQRLSVRLYEKNLAQQRAVGRLGNLVQENLAGAHVVRAFGMEQAQAAHFDAANQQNYLASVDVAFTRSYLSRLMGLFAAVSVLIVLYFGARAIMHGQLSPGELVALTEYLALLAWPSLALGWIVGITQRGLSALERIGAVLDTEPTIRSGSIAEVPLAPSLAVASLTLERGGRRVLDGVDVLVPAGHTLGIVGPIGAGKSSLVHALVRELDVPPRTVFAGGVDIGELELGTLRRLFGFVHQTPVLFSKTIAENVAFGRPAAARHEVLAAVQLACLDVDLPTLPMGLETPAGERGITLSGGQKQRTAIARAVLLDPPILVLDDALSAVDADTETRILARLRQLRRGRTTVIVAHRFSAVQHADEVLVLDAGRVVERGTPAALLAQGGLYSRMARRQELEQGLAAAPGTRQPEAQGA